MYIYVRYKKKRIRALKNFITEKKNERPNVFGAVTMKKINDQLPTTLEITTLSFSEHEIIRLQDVFLTPGFHAIKTNNRASGQLFIKKFLKSLNYYHSLACLSSAYAGADRVLNVYAHLNKPDYDYAGSIQDFILEELYCDFMWIEETPEVIRKPWYPDFKQSLVDFNFDKTIPIITISYTQTEN